MECDVCYNVCMCVRAYSVAARGPGVGLGEDVEGLGVTTEALN